MNYTKHGFIVAFCTALLFAALPTAAQASIGNQRTLVTINEPLALPGVVLAPGTYTLKLLSPVIERDVVGVFNAQDTRLVRIFLVMPDYRRERTSKPAFQLAERPKDDPMALKAWFFAGQHAGVEFHYPKWQSHPWG